MPGMEIKHGILRAPITDSIGYFNKVRCMPLLYFDETILLKRAKGPKPLPTTSIMDGGRDSNLLGFQSFPQCKDVLGILHPHRIVPHPLSRS